MCSKISFLLLKYTLYIGGCLWRRQKQASLLWKNSKPPARLSFLRNTRSLIFLLLLERSIIMKNSSLNLGPLNNWKYACFIFCRLYNSACIRSFKHWIHNYFRVYWNSWWLVKMTIFFIAYFNYELSSFINYGSYSYPISWKQEEHM